MHPPRLDRIRPLLAILLALTLFAPSAVAPQNAAAAGSGKIQIENLDRIPYNDRLVFQRINSNFSGPTHKTVTLRIKNIDTTPLNVSSLTITGGDSASFTIPNADKNGFILQPSEARDITVSFGAGTAGTTKGLRQSTLLIQSSDATTPSLPVQLAGFNMVNDGGTNEPSLQEIAETFGYTTNILNPGESQSLRGKKVEGSDPPVYIQNSVGDEIYSAQWARADASQPVYVRQLAALSGSASDAATVCIGNTCATHGPDQFQSFLPFQGTAGNLGAPVEITANPGSSFVIKAGNYATDRDPARGRGVRLWTARDRSGVLIPNTYIVGQDYVGSSATNFDYQDNAYIVTNIRPTNQAIDPNRVAPAPGNPNLVLDFDRTYQGTLADNNDEGTGFGDTQRNRNDITAPESGPTSSYDKTKLDLNTGGQGTLTIKTSAGSNSGTDNTLVNGLCNPFDGRSGRFVVSTRLIGPLNTFTAAYQQAGIMFGPSQGNFLKLTAGVQVTGSVGKPWIQFVQELSNVPTQIGELSSIPNAAAITTLDLQLTGDAATGKVEAGYRINDGIPVTLPDSVTLTGTARARFFDLQTKGCLIALHKNATELNVAFDRFAVTPAPVATNLPQVSAGADQQVQSGTVVTLNGTATPASGATITGVTWEQVSGSRIVTLNGTGNSRTFTAPSGYSVLTFAFAATDSQGRSASDTVTITVGTEPISGLNITTNSPVELGLQARFSASTTAGSTPITYEWDFGDGSPKVVSGPVVTHTYAAVGSYTVMLTARNAANSPTVQTTVVVQEPVPAFAFRYNVGGPTVNTPDGLTWTTDAGLFSPNAPAEKRKVAPEIANTENDIIYQDYRGKVTTLPKILTFEFPINSKLGLKPETRVLVDVRLHFAELYWGGSQGITNTGSIDKRVFDVFAEGSLVLNNFDIAAEAGGADRAVIIPLDGVAVTDGKLTIALQAVKDYPSLAAIEIIGSPKEVPENNPPTADAGANQTVAVGTQVTLTGSGSDPNGDALTYSWAQTGGPAVTLGGSNLVRTFTPATPGSYIFTFTVTDAKGLQGADTVVITVNDTTQPPNNPPTAVAGQNQTALVGTTITLTGSGSDPDGDAITYAWEQTSGPAVSLNGNPGDATRIFTPTLVGSYIFTFTVTDARGLSGADTVVITITDTPPANNQQPVANAGTNQTVGTGTPVTLNGGASSDPDGNPITYSWQQTGGPAVTLNGDATAQPTFVAPNQPTTLTFQLIVTDAFGVSSSADEVQVIVIDGPVGTTENHLFLPIVIGNR